MGQSSEINRTALVVDVREGTQLEVLPAIVKSVKRLLAHQSDFPGGQRMRCCCAASARPAGPILSEQTRTVKVFAGDGTQASAATFARMADLVIDTSKFNVHELRAYITERFHKKETGKSILVSCVSFGFSHGVPEDS